MLLTQFLSRIMLLLCMGVAIPLGNLQQPANASEVINSPITKDRQINALININPFVHTLNNRLVLKLQERRVYLYQGDEVLISYPVAIGKKGWETPTGNFQIIQKVRQPSWQHPWNGTIFPPGPENPLGERWIGFWTDGKNYIGFHGTPGENLIGQAVSHGCVRMRNRDVKTLFELVKMGTPVIVEP